MDFLQFLNNGYDPRLIIGYGGLGYHPQLHMYGEGGLGYNPKLHMYGDGLTKLVKFTTGSTNEDPIDFQLDLYKEDEGKEEEKTFITDESYKEAPDITLDIIDYLTSEAIDEEDRKNLEIIKFAIESNKFKEAYKEAKEKGIAPKIDLDEKVFDDVIDRANKLMVESNVEKQELLKEKEKEKRIKKREPEPEPEEEGEVEDEDEEVIEEPEIVPYKNKIYELAGKEAKQKYPGIPVHIARGNVMEDILDQYQDFFEAINPDVGSDNVVYNTKREDCPFYTEDMIDYYKKNKNLYSNYTKQKDERLKKLINDNASPDAIETAYKAFIKAEEAENEYGDKLKYMVVDYLSKNSLFELKTLKDSYETLKKRGNVHLITNKIEGEAGEFKPKFIETKDGRFCETITRFDRLTKTNYETIVKSKYSYEVIFCLSDGFYIYDVLKDPDIIINKNGRARINETREVNGKKESTKEYINMGGKDKEHYLIPIDRIRQMNKSDYERIFKKRIKK